MDGLSVRDVLQMSVVKRALPEVTAGERHLDRTIRWVHVVDAQHPQGLLKGGELVLTTGVGIPRDDEAAQREFIHDLDDQGVSAVIGPGAPFGAAITESMAAAAENRGLPLIALHRFTRFVEITEAVHGDIIARDLAALRDSDEFTARMAKLVSDGGGIPELLREIAHSVQAPVALESLDRQLVAHDAGQSAEDVFLSMWRHHLASEAFDNLQAPGVHIHGIRLPSGPWGRLICFETGEPLSPGQARILERAADLISLTLRGQGEVEHVARSTGSLLHLLAIGSIDERGAIEKARALGLKSSPALLPFAAGWRAAPVSLMSPNLAWTRLIRRLRADLEERGHSLLIGPWDHLIVGVISVKDTRVDPGELDALAGLLHAACAAEGVDETAIAITFGAAQSTWLDVGATVEALVVASRASLIQPWSPWFDARRMSVTSLVFGLIDDPTLEVFVHQQLGPLVDDDSRRAKEMIATIASLTKNGGRRADTARALNLTRQSLYYRLEKIEEMLDVDLTSGETLVGLQLAIVALPMLKQRRNFIAANGSAV